MGVDYMALGASEQKDVVYSTTDWTGAALLKIPKCLFGNDKDTRTTFQELSGYLCCLGSKKPIRYPVFL